MIRLMNMSDVYVEYKVSSTTGSPNAIRVFAKVPRAKIEAYRQAQNDHASSDTDIAYNQSELPALSRFPQPHWRSSVSYPDALPAELQEWLGTGAMIRPGSSPRLPGNTVLGDSSSPVPLEQENLELCGCCCVA